MNVLSPTRPPPPLHDLLGVSFVFNSVPRALAWDRDFACFGLADGSVAMLRAHWDGAPALGPRPAGGVHIVAGTAPPPPPAIFPVHTGEILCLSGDPLGGIISGGADGLFRRLIDGEMVTLETRPRKRISAVAAGRGGRRAFAAGRQVDVLGPDARRITTTGAVTALAYDPSGLHLAVGYDGGVSLEAAGFRRAAKLERAGPQMLAWAPDGGMVAVAGRESGVVLRARAADDWVAVEGLAGAPRGIGFTPDGALLIAGENFVCCWRGGVMQNVAGLSGHHPAAPIACHPRRDIFACADGEGRILLGRRQGGPAMVIREPGAAPLFLAFAPDGEALAFAADDGEAGTVILPDLLFRPGESR